MGTLIQFEKVERTLPFEHQREYFWNGEARGNTARTYFKILHFKEDISVSVSIAGTSREIREIEIYIHAPYTGKNVTFAIQLLLSFKSSLFAIRSHCYANFSIRFVGFSFCFFFFHRSSLFQQLALKMARPREIIGAKLCVIYEQAYFRKVTGARTA